MLVSWQPDTSDSSGPLRCLHF